MKDICWAYLCFKITSCNYFYSQSHSNGVSPDEPYEDLMRDKEGLEVSRMIDFGTLKKGESKRMIVWIE